MSRDSCPNCGHRLGMLREQHQQAGTRRIRLRWLICSQCRHVALDDWSFIDGDTSGPRPDARPAGPAQEKSTR